MTSDDLEALVLADAAGALDPSEQQQLRARMAELPSHVRREMAELYDTTVTLAASVSGPRPSARVRERLLARLAGSR